ncbi:hypothetical protein GH714_032839 [Hevea brasiliensis]|uniref:Uncharacterized protein n=1 Tax=Hevea brasiliensis TaxID=3981 RepID=A0A6A6N968_HEVBR|nr:hypothetical protein GH714_032839 [Hevea brasiliensis]
MGLRACGPRGTSRRADEVRNEVHRAGEGARECWACTGEACAGEVQTCTGKAGCARIGFNRHAIYGNEASLVPAVFGIRRQLSVNCPTKCRMGHLESRLLLKGSNGISVSAGYLDVPVYNDELHHWKLKENEVEEITKC